MAKKTKPKAGGGAGVKGVDLAEVERLLSFMENHKLEEFEFEREGFHIRLRKASAHSGGGFWQASPPPASAPAPAPSHAPAAAAAHERAEEAPVAGDIHIVKSPIVGTFYSAPGPDAAPFVTVGAQVASGQALCIIEAMKLMNEIESDIAGEVVKVFVENGHPVEYGESLFGIRPKGKK
jgi:acetyl-CoA carboxylase biotin carboxyl carrier protein